MTAAAKTPVIDTHLHFWDLATYDHDDWLKSSPEINRSFLPDDLKPHFEACGVDRGVIIEAARDVHRLNLWWLQLAAEHEIIGAVAVGCSLEQESLPAWLDEYGQGAYFAGVGASAAAPPGELPGQPEHRRGPLA